MHLLQLEDKTAAQEVEDSDMENEIYLSPGLEQSSCDTPCENDQPPSGPPTSGYPLCWAKYRSKKKKKTMSYKKLQYSTRLQTEFLIERTKGSIPLKNRLGRNLGELKIPP